MISSGSTPTSPRTKEIRGGEFVRLGLLYDDAARNRRDTGALERALEDLRARYGRAIYAEWYGSPFSHCTRAVFEELHSLEELRWTQNGTNTEGAPIHAVAELPHLAGMRRLEVTSGGKIEEALIALAGSAHARSLRSLRVNNSITPPALEALIQSENLPELGWLNWFAPRKATDGLMQRALHRFGYRLYCRNDPHCPLVEPDLDPWNTGARTS